MVTRPRAESGSTKKIRTGVAISPTEICAADIRLRGSSDRAWRATLEPPQIDGGSWPSLATAFADLANTLGTTNGTLTVALMPPLTEVRRLELPPLRDDELQRILSRDASKYFVGARTPQIVGASRSARRTRGAPSAVVAAAASGRLVALIRAAAQMSGWAIEMVAPAETAWAAAAIALWPPFARQNAYALIAHDDRTDLLQIEDGRLIGVRRFRAEGLDAPMIVDTVGPTARIGIAGSPTRRRELSLALAALGLTVVVPSGEWSAAADRPDLLAAHFAGSEIGPVLRSEDVVERQRADVRRATWIVAGVAAALFVVAAGVELWGVHHQLDEVRGEREQLKPQIASTMVGRNTVDAAYRHLATLSGIERASPHWSAVIANLSESIPDDAHLSAIRARDDSLLVDGLASHAARVFDALEKTPGLVDVKAAAAVRRELQDDGKALEHFTISARALPSQTSAAARPASSATGRRAGQ